MTYASIVMTQAPEKIPPQGHRHAQLKKCLRPIHLWSIAVGLVISGEYFGWSYGWGIAGPVGFLISTLIVAVLYTCFVFSYTELTTSVPEAGGAYAYAQRGLGPWAGLLAGYAALIEFVFAPPAIAFALGSYIHFIYPSVPILNASLLGFFFFCVINLFGVHQTARFELVVTLIAVVELLVFIALVGPHFKAEYFLKDAYPMGHVGVFAAIPYAIWFFLAIEGVAMAAEEVRNPSKDIPIGYLSGIGTLVFLAFAVMLAAGGAGDWRKLSQMDYPIPEAMAMAMGPNNPWVKTLAGIGIFGLVASLNGIIYSGSRQVFALARGGLLPNALAQVNSRFQSPHWAILFVFLCGTLSILSGKTSELILLSGLGAVFMYIVSLMSLFALRRKEPHLKRPYRVPFFPFVPLVALILSLVSFGSIVYYNQKISVLFLGLFTAGILSSMIKKGLSQERLVLDHKEA